MPNAQDRFAIVRSDGRSTSQVLIDYLADAQPGRVYSYAELAEALSVGLSVPFPASEVPGAVARTYSRLLKEKARALHNVRTVGYRVAFASEHRMLAKARKRRADVQFRRGVDTLRHVQWNEMNENERKAHEGHMMIAEALFANQVSMERRLRAVEEAIAHGK